MSVVGEACCASEAIEMARTQHPDLILMDISLTDGSGVDATHTILADRPETKIVFLTMHEEEELLFAGIRSGAKGYLLKNLPVPQFLAYIRGVEHGEAAITPAMAGRILDEFSRSEPVRAAGQSDVTGLTEREIEVLRELSMGASNREIAELFVIAEGTVKNHVRSILAKLHLKNRQEAAQFARGHGL